MEHCNINRTSIFMYSGPVKLNYFLRRKHERHAICLKLQQGLTV